MKNTTGIFLCKMEKSTFLTKCSMQELIFEVDSAIMVRKKRGVLSVRGIPEKRGDLWLKNLSMTSMSAPHSVS